MAVRNAGQIILCRFPQTDLATGKRRPALLLLPLPTDYNDWLICMMSTKTEQAVSDIDDIISTSDSDFQTTGLKGDTVLRITRLAAVTDSLFTGTIGHIGSERLTRVKENLARWILAS